MGTVISAVAPNIPIRRPNPGTGEREYLDEGPVPQIIKIKDETDEERQTEDLKDQK